MIIRGILVTVWLLGAVARPGPSASIPSQQATPIEFQMRNVNFRIAKDIVLEVRTLRGQLKRTKPDVPVTFDDGASTCNVFGSTPCRIANTILITPATPAAACVCPMLDFREPRNSGLFRSWP